MIKLYQYPLSWGMNVSPFTLKLETWLRLSNLDYQVIAVHSPRSAPKGKLPYIRDGDKLVADSELIRKHLEQGYGVNAYAGLTPAEKADGWAFARLVEDHLYWCAMYDHWQVDEHWAEIKPMFFGKLPPDQRDMVADGVRNQIIRDLHGQGIGRHNPSEVAMLGELDIQALHDRLGAGPYWFGEQPTSADAAIAPHILAIANDPLKGALSQAIAARPSLITYAKRVLEVTIPDRLG